MNLSERLVGEKAYNLDLGAEGFLGGSVVKNLPAMQETQEMQVRWIPELGRSPGGGRGNHSRVLAWRSLRPEEPGGLQFMRFQESDMTEDRHAEDWRWNCGGKCSKKKKKKGCCTSHQEGRLKIIS